MFRRVNRCRRMCSLNRAKKRLSISSRNFSSKGATQGGKCSWLGYDLELAHHFEHLISIRNLVLGQFAQTFEAECFHAKTRQHASVDHRFPHYLEGHVFPYVRRQVTGETASKSVPCPGRIVNIFQRISACAKKFVFAKKQRTMLAILHRHIVRSIFSNSSSGSIRAVLFH